ncbi:MAG: hypothetical protein MJY99_08830 [Fibrobacter sp.]|nr:hypothetical protein [Fibrobacter sp.]
MANIAKMEMANALFKKKCIKVEKAFFGLKTNVTYTPTNSSVVGDCLDFSCADSKKVVEFFEAAPNQVEALVQKEGQVKQSCNGNTRLFLCYSKDRKFAAMQLFLYSNFEYRAQGDAKFFEGSDAEKKLKAFVG